MACLGIYAEVQDYIDLWCIEEVDPEAERRIESVLALASGPINMARMASNGCACSLSAEGAQTLKFLSCVIAAVMYNCPCGTASLSDEMKSTYLSSVVNPMLEQIRLQQLELCSGATGADFPALGYAEIAWSANVGAQIYLNRFKRLLEEEA